MPAPAQPQLEPGRVYRTRELAVWGANPARLASRMVREGRLQPLTQGLFYAPRDSRFGRVPPEDAEILRAFLGSDEFVVTGPPHWNALGLGATALFPVVLVYNTRRSGEFALGRRRYRLRRVRFPRQPNAEWYAIDLLEHREMAGTSQDRLATALAEALRHGRFDQPTLRRMAREYGTRRTQDLVECAIRAATA
ncbi:MAG: hypothetical protein GY842_08920 [bacterium]|nr:hypothetical protein [bacterium]